MIDLNLPTMFLLAVLVNGAPQRTKEPRLPTGHFILIEGALLKRTVDLPMNNVTVVDGKASVVRTFIKTPLTKTLTIDGSGKFEESIFAGPNRMNAGEGMWRYRFTGPRQVELRSPRGEKRTLRYTFQSGRLTLTFGKKSVEVYRKE